MKAIPKHRGYVVLTLFAFVLLISACTQTSPAPTGAEPDDTADDAAGDADETVGTDDADDLDNATGVPGNREVGENTVQISSSGYSPATLTVQEGEAVTWINNDNQPHWIATAQHPTHRIYPGSDIEKCGTAEQEGIFDSCQSINPGESWSFTFDEIGNWSYHDHLNARAPFFGKVVVE